MNYRHVFATLALAATTTAAPAVAQPDPYPYRYLPTRCVVGYVGGPQRVVVAIGSTDDQALIDVAASTCTLLIDSGEWTGVANDDAWKADMRPVAYIQPAFAQDESLNVWSTSDRPSVILGTTVGIAFERDGNYFVVFP